MTNGSRSIRFSADRRESYPALVLSADGTAVDLTVFPLDGLRRAPLDRINERPMRRATLESVQALML